MFGVKVRVNVKVDVDVEVNVDVNIDINIDFNRVDIVYEAKQLLLVFLPLVFHLYYENLG